MINKIIRKTSPSQKRNPYSYKERGSGGREWKEIMKAKIQYLKEDLVKEIEAYIRESK